MPELTCTFCGKLFDMRNADFNRQQKRTSNFFCGLSCAAKFRNAIRPDRRINVMKVCPHCGREFITKTGAKTATFCSRSCASAGSVTVKRRERARETGRQNLRHDIEAIATGLRSREAWKYVDLKEYLERHNIAHEFEIPVGGQDVFDLGIPGKKLLVEFDGKDHIGAQLNEDTAKRERAEVLGWRVTHIQVSANQVIRSQVLYNLELWRGQEDG